MDLFQHPLWPYIKPYAHMPPGRDNCDFLHLPDQLRELALGVYANCVSCHSVIHPLRARQLSNRSRIKGSGIEKRLFYAATCPAKKNPGCSRTEEAKNHKGSLKFKLGIQDLSDRRTIMIDFNDIKNMTFENGRAKIENLVGDSIVIDANVAFRAYHFLQLEALRNESQIKPGDIQENSEKAINPIKSKR